MNDLKVLERGTPEYPELSTFLIQLAQVTFFLNLIYNGELVAPYERIIKIITHSSLELWFYTNEPEEILRILKKEDE